MAIHGLLRGAFSLDVGGGVGECCVHLIDKHDVLGADASKSIPVNTRTRMVNGLFSGQFARDSFDLAVLNHLLEHVFSPAVLLESTQLVLRPGGIVVIEVPFELFTPL
jgi:ubiquinone/menaquinone biosynthesis C-methylase UbiE